MKRVALLCLGLAVGAASAAEAQLTMQMSNGWSFTFAGNVNAFFVYDATEARYPHHIGPYLEDLTPIRFTALLAREIDKNKPCFTVNEQDRFISQEVIEFVRSKLASGADEVAGRVQPAN